MIAITGKMKQIELVLYENGYYLLIDTDQKPMAHGQTWNWRSKNVPMNCNTESIFFRKISRWQVENILFFGWLIQVMNID